MKRTVKIKSFNWDEEFTSAGTKGYRRCSAKRGDEIDVSKEVVKYGEDMGAFVTEEDEAVEAEEAQDVAAMNEEELVDWVSEATVPDIVNVARTDPELAQPLLAAENTATGNDPRGGLAELLAEVAGEGEPAPEKDNGEIVDVEYTAGAETLATESGVDLAEVEGTGKDGRITKGDVEAHIDAQAEGQE